MEIDKLQIISRFKQSKNIKTDAHLCRILGISPSTLATWKKRNSMNFELIFAKCEDVNIDWLITGRGQNSKIDCDACPKVQALQEKIISLLESRPSAPITQTATGDNNRQSISTD